MRGDDERSEGFFSYVRLETRIPADHPLRSIRELVDPALLKLSPAFDRLYAREGRPIDPAGATVASAAAAGVLHGAIGTAIDGTARLQSVVPLSSSGLSMDDPVWDATVFCKNRDRLLDGDIAAKFFASVLNLPQVRSQLSSEHFSVDGTLIEAWASMKSFVPKAGRKPAWATAAAGAAGAIRSATSMARSAGTIRIPRPPTPMPGCSAKPPAKRPSSATWGI